MSEKTHYRKAFDSPYLSSADLIDAQVFTIRCVKLESDKTKKTKDLFNTAYFVEKDIRPGEPLKPMILNATNSKTLKNLTGSPFIDDWAGTKIMIYVDHNVRFGKEIMEGLRISPNKQSKDELTPDNEIKWNRAKQAFKRDGNLKAVLQHVDISEENQQRLIDECAA